MIHIRFPDGQCIRYNDAIEHTVLADGTINIIHKDTAQKRWLTAVIAPGTQCVIEFVQPCAVSNPIAREMTPESALELVLKHLRTLPAHKLKEIKLALFKFNAKRRTWRI